MLIATLEPPHTEIQSFYEIPACNVKVSVGNVEVSACNVKVSYIKEVSAWTCNVKVLARNVKVPSCNVEISARNVKVPWPPFNV